MFLAQSTGAVEYTDCISSEGKTLPMNIRNITQKNPMVKFL